MVYRCSNCVCVCGGGVVCGVALLLFLVKKIAECFCLKCDVAVCTIRGLV